MLIGARSFDDLESRLEPVRWDNSRAELHMHCSDPQARILSEVRIRLRTEKLRMLMLAGFTGTVLVVRVMLTVRAVMRRRSARRCSTHCIALGACEQCGNEEQSEEPEPAPKHPNSINSTNPQTQPVNHD